MAANPLVVARPYTSVVPAGYDPQKPTPLLLLLHGYSSQGILEDAYFGLSSIVDQRGFLYAYPDGTVDQVGLHFWNADDACCNFFGSTVDDVAYLNAVVDDMSARYNVDPRRIFVAGHSNGGFMAHRLACDSAGRFAAAMALAGDVWLDASKCNPSQPIAILQVHGDADQSILYGGGTNGLGKPYPSAHDSVATWAQKNHCSTTTTPGAPMTLDGHLPRDQTAVDRYTGCAPGGAAELWTIHGGTHVPIFVAGWANILYDWLSAHARP
jgi:polyhydroxybutyrate depolymerase